MKRLKKGFSLSELLIAMGIVSIIAVMGFTIAKRGIEDAYDRYIFTGYSNFMDAMNFAISEGVSSTDTVGLSNSIASLFEGEITSDGSILAPNGIEYSFKHFASTPGSAPSEIKRYYSLEMKVPSVNKNGTNKQSQCFVYAPYKEWSILIPVNQIDHLPKQEEHPPICTSSIQNLHKRIDLLQFYIDDGNVGRRIPPDYKYQPKVYLTAEQALCAAYGDKIKITILDTPIKFIDCSGVTYPTETPTTGIIKYANPKSSSGDLPQ